MEKFDSSDDLVTTESIASSSFFQSSPLTALTIKEERNEVLETCSLDSGAWCRVRRDDDSSVAERY